MRKTLANVNGNAAKRATTQRKTLMHRRSNEHNDETERTGLQNSVFDLDKIERKLAKLAQVHLILEHMLSIRTNLEDEQHKCMFD